jgi:hypothetical protein
MTNSRMYRALFQSAVLTTTVLGCTDQKPTTPQASEPEVVLMSVSDKQPALFKNVARYSEIGSSMAMSAVQAGDVTVSVRALLGSDGRVTLVVTTGHIDAEDAPGTIEHLQVKLLDPNGNEKRTLNYDDIDGGRAEIILPTGVRGGTIFVHANVKGIGNGTDVVKVETTIKLLPDLAIGSFNTPEEALRNAPVNISAVVTEKNGDFGARGDCVLFEDGVEISRATGIWVDAGRSVTCAFLPRFATAGTKKLTVSILGCNPTDWDATNNSVSLPITIVDPRALNDFVWSGRVSGRANIRGIERSEGFWELPAYEQRAEWSFYKEYQGEGWRDANVDGRRPSGLSGPLTATYKDRIDATVLNDGAFDPTKDRRTTFEADQNNSLYGKVHLKQACSSLTRTVTVTGPRGNIPATVARLLVCSNVYSGAPGAEKLSETWFSYSAYAGDVTYYANDYSLYVSPGYKDAYTFNGNIDYTFGTIATGSEYAFEVKVTGVDGSLTSSGIIPLTAEEKSEVTPFQCTEYSGNGYSERSCTEKNLTYTKFGGTAKGVIDPRP